MNHKGTQISNKQNYKALSEKKKIGVLDMWSLMRGDRLWEVIAYGRSSIGHVFSYRADQYFLP